MPTQTTTRVDRLFRQINDIDLKLQREGDFIPTDIDVVGFRTHRDEPILLVRTGHQTLALRDEATRDERGNSVPGFLDREGYPVAAADFGPLRLYRLGRDLYEIFVSEFDSLDGAAGATEALVEDVKAALRRVSGYQG